MCSLALNDAITASYIHHHGKFYYLVQIGDAVAGGRTAPAKFALAEAEKSPGRIWTKRARI